MLHNNVSNNHPSYFTRLSNGVLPKHEAMKYEVLRLSTFKLFPSNVPISAIQLSQVGFFYSGTGDEVECYSCSLKLKDWGPTDNPYNIHRKYSPNCPFMCNNVMDNIPMASKSSQHFFNTLYSTTQFNGHSKAIDSLDTTVTSRNVTNLSLPVSLHQQPLNKIPIISNVTITPVDLDLAHLKTWEPGDPTESEQWRHTAQCSRLKHTATVGDVKIYREWKCVGSGKQNKNNDIYKQDCCKRLVNENAEHPQYIRFSERLATFKDFPANIIQTPQQFTKAGFFYSGTKDSVKCFFCDGSLHKWEPNDDPWTEHARWFPKCGYLRLCKGDEFINQIQDNLRSPLQDPPGFQHSIQRETETKGKRDKKKSKKKKKKKNKSKDPLNVIANVTPLQYNADEAKTLQADAQRMKDERLCKICMEEEVSVVFLRCGHLVCCSNCAPALRHCPICREKIIGTVKVFMS